MILAFDPLPSLRAIASPVLLGFILDAVLAHKRVYDGLGGYTNNLVSDACRYLEVKMLFSPTVSV